MKKASKIILTVVISIICGVLALLLLVWGGLNIVKYPLYWEYYSVKDDVCINPGLYDGFACQGICADEESGKIFVSGYMMDDSASRIYVTDENNDSYYVSVKGMDGKDFTGHSGGLALCGNVIYIASDDALHFIWLDDILNADNGETVSIYERVKVNNQASFVYVDDNYIYVGEFHNGKQYITEHPYNDPDEGMHYAIVSRYLQGEFAPGGEIDREATPDRIYSIRNKVQGICFEGGKVVMSTSYGLTDSIYYIYDEGRATYSGETLDGAPVYFLGECESSFRGPAMSEGLALYDGKVMTLTESACDKYIFGKFFFANKIVALDILD